MVEGWCAFAHIQGGGSIAHVSVITGPQMDASEQSRAASKVPLPQEISLDGSPDDLIPEIEFYRLYGFEEHPTVKDYLQSQRNIATAKLMNEKAKYVDQLSHFRGRRTLNVCDVRKGIDSDIAKAMEQPVTVVSDEPVKVLSFTDDMYSSASERFTYISIDNESDRNAVPQSKAVRDCEAVPAEEPHSDEDTSDV